MATAKAKAKAKAKGELKVGIVRHDDLRRMCDSYCMAAAIHHSLRLEKAHWWGGLEAMVDDPPKLRRLRENIFQQKLAKQLKSAYVLCPRDFAAWVGEIEREKQYLMKEIEAVYEKARAANQQSAEQLLAYQRMSVAVGYTAGCAFTILAAGAVLLTVGTAALASVGVVTAETALSAAMAAGGAGKVVIAYSIAKVSVSAVRNLSEMEAADVLCTGGGIAAEQVAHHAGEHATKDVIRRNAVDVLIDRNVVQELLDERSAGLCQTPFFRQIVLRNRALNRAIAKKLAGAAAFGIADVFCARQELHENYEQLIKDWNAGTPDERNKQHEGSGHEQHENHVVAHHL